MVCGDWGRNQGRNRASSGEAVPALNNRIHISRSLYIVLFGSVLLGGLFSLCWVTAAYGHVPLSAQFVRWVTAVHEAGLTALYRGLLYFLGIGAVAGAIIAVLDRAIASMEPRRHPPAR